jgi:hyperosmotically inducible periplasmic protein
MRQLILGLSCFGLCFAVSSCDPPTPIDKSGHAAAQSPAAYSPDNTGRNVRDKDGTSLVPTDQSNEERDLQITRDVRQLLVSDPGLSGAARNVKIITVGRVVTLRGPVQSEEEKETIQKTAEIVRGVASVDNQLEISAR